MLAIILLEHESVVNASSCESYNDGKSMRCVFPYDETWDGLISDSHPSTINITAWGGGGGGGGYLCVMESFGVYVKIGGAGGGSGSTIFRYPVSYNNETIQVIIGSGGSPGKCSYYGNPTSSIGTNGGETRVYLGSNLIITGYGGGAGGSWNIKTTAPYMYSGGGGGSFSSAGNYYGGLGCNTTYQECYSTPTGRTCIDVPCKGGSGYSGATCDTLDCSPESGITYGYWHSGGNGGILENHGSDWIEPCYRDIYETMFHLSGICTQGGIPVAYPHLNSGQGIFGNGLSHAQYKLGGGAAGFYGNGGNGGQDAQPNSGAGGGALYCTDITDLCSTKMCNSCYGGHGGSGGVIIEYDII